MKKIMSFLLSLAMIASLASTTFAADFESGPSNNIQLSDKLYISSYTCPEQYTSFAQEKIHLFLEASEFSNLSPCYLGDAFTFSNSGSDIFYFPVYYSGKVICLLRVYSNEQGDIAGVLSKGFADELNAVAPFTSIADPLQIYLEGTDVVFETATMKKAVLSYPNTDSIAEPIVADNVNLTRSTIECSVEDASLILPQAQLQSIASNSKYLDIFESNGYPAETQDDGESWCAAYAAAAIMRYKGIHGMYAREIMEYYYGSGVQPSDALTDENIQTYATLHGFRTSLINSTLSYVSLCNEIDSYRPVYIVMHRQVGTVHKYHAVVLCGYNDASAMVRIWNPLYEYYETIYSLSNYVPTEHQSRTYSYAETIYNWTT